MKKTLKQHYSESFDYIKKSKNFIFAILLIFLIFALIGFIVPASESITQKLLGFIHELLEKTKGMNFFELSWFIFFNNLKVSLLGMLFGILFGIFPILAGIVNGYMIGFVASTVCGQEGFLSLWKIFPHGIFELPAIFISLGLGLKMGMFILKKKKVGYLQHNLHESSRIFFLIVLPLIILAALIESALIFLLG